MQHTICFKQVFIWGETHMEYSLLLEQVMYTWPALTNVICECGFKSSSGEAVSIKWLPADSHMHHSTHPQAQRQEACDTASSALIQAPLAAPASRIAIC